MAANENLSPKVIRELLKELKNIEADPPQDIRVIINEENFANIHAEIDGPAGTPYEGGFFRLKLVLSQDFPQSPPKGYFLTRIFHPNIAKNGEICVNTLKKDWKATLGLRHVLLVIRCLLIEPFPESALNEEAGKMLMEDYEGYAKHTKLMTSIHALKPKPMAKVNNVANADLGDGAATPPAPLSLNTEGVLTEAAATLGVQGGGDAVKGLGSPTAKKPKADANGKVVDKKKVLTDRKRALKRL